MAVCDGPIASKSSGVRGGHCPAAKILTELAACAGDIRQIPVHTDTDDARIITLARYKASTSRSEHGNFKLKTRGPSESPVILVSISLDISISNLGNLRDLVKVHGFQYRGPIHQISVGLVRQDSPFDRLLKHLEPGRTSRGCGFLFWRGLSPGGV